MREGFVGKIPQKSGVDIALIKTAYQTLFDPTLRAEYDAALNDANLSSTFHRISSSGVVPRPAEVISLDDFSEYACEGDQFWTHTCRCGAEFKLAEGDLEAGKHLVACERCSEVVFVGYEEVEDGEAVDG